MLDPNVIVGAIFEVISDAVNLLFSDIPWWLWLILMLEGVIYFLTGDKLLKDERR